MDIVSLNDLRLADIVRFPNYDSYNVATVKFIGPDYVEFFRPYVHTGDFEYTGGVLCYVGIECFKAYKNDNKDLALLDRKNLE